MIYLERGLAWSENGEGRGPRIAFLCVTHGCLCLNPVHINIFPQVKMSKHHEFVKSARSIWPEDARACIARAPLRTPTALNKFEAHFT
jgi:hypothetical protein